jgi:hypothetical protein
MRSPKPGTSTSGVEVLNVSPHGLWLYVNGSEFFLSYEDYAWFKDARIREILNVERRHNHHLLWPDLDIDLEIESLQSPEKYPLCYKS